MIPMARTRKRHARKRRSIIEEMPADDTWIETACTAVLTLLSHEAAGVTFVRSASGEHYEITVRRVKTGRA